MLLRTKVMQVFSGMCSQQGLHFPTHLFVPFTTPVRSFPSCLSFRSSFPIIIHWFHLQRSCLLNAAELNQYVSLKKIVPYRKQEWHIPQSQRAKMYPKLKGQASGNSGGDRLKGGQGKRGREDASSTWTDPKAASNMDRRSRKEKKKREKGKRLPKNLQ